MDPVAAACLRAWQLDVGLAATLLLAAALYVRGWRRLRTQMPERFGIGPLAAFGAGLAALWLAVGSPLDALASFLLQAHMLQHLLLTMVAPPLLWLGAPAIPLL
ncbi:MAG: cytochrome c oxidase assembly protein, partial [Candidatus Binatia bacterium]